MVGAEQLRLSAQPPPLDPVGPTALREHQWKARVPSNQPGAGGPLRDIFNPGAYCKHRAVVGRPNLAPLEWLAKRVWGRAAGRLRSDPEQPEFEVGACGRRT